MRTVLKLTNLFYSTRIFKQISSEQFMTQTYLTDKHLHINRSIFPESIRDAGHAVDGGGGVGCRAPQSEPSTAIRLGCLTLASA